MTLGFRGLRFGGFGVYGLRFLGFGLWGFRVSGLGSTVEGFGLLVWQLSRVYGLCMGSIMLPARENIGQFLKATHTGNTVLGSEGIEFKPSTLNPKGFAQG